jgi:hydroxymethylglutaryl-CoA synthase
MDDACARGLDIAGKNVLAVGYGSGDAAEAIPMTLTDTWQEAARKIRFNAALDSYQNLTRAQYESLHDTGTAADLAEPDDGFVIESIGTSSNPRFSDEGIEYYRYVQ